MSFLRVCVVSLVILIIPFPPRRANQPWSPVRKTPRSLLISENLVIKG